MSKDLSLYELSGDLQVLHDEIMEAEGEITPDLERALDRLNLLMTEKVEKISRWYLSLQRTGEALDAEIERLKNRRNARRNLQDRLKAYMKLCLEKAEKTRLEFSTLTVTLQRNPPSVAVLDHSQLPARFVRITTVSEVDKDGLREALRAGERIPGAVLVTDKTHLRIS